MKQATSNILKNKNLEENLKVYFKEFKELNNRYALVHFALNYYTYYSMVMEDEISNKDNISYSVGINKIVENIKDTSTHSSSIETLLIIRNELIKKVRCLTEFVDKFNIYEYALNRVEYRFQESNILENYTDESFTKKLMQFVFSDENNMMTNLRISTITSQIPVRYTKSKFFEIINNGISVYKNGDKKSFDNFLYMLRTSSILVDMKDANNEYPQIAKIFEEFQKINFKKITSEEYEKMSYNITMASDYIRNEMDIYSLIMNNVNDLLNILYTYKEVDIPYCKAALEIIVRTNNLFLSRGNEKEKDIEAMFVQLEGVQENLYPELTSENIVLEIEENCSEYISEELESEFQIIKKLPILTNDSLFMEFDVATQEELTEDYVKECENQLIKEYIEFFNNNQRIINRAVMAMAIGELPIMYNNISEFQDTLYNSLSTCTDGAEKIACIEILNDIMKE